MKNAQLYWLVLGVLAVWRVTHLLHAEDGPWDLLVGLRRLAGDRSWGGLLDCFYCLSLWVSVPVAVLVAASRAELPLLWLTLSAGAIFLERLTDRGEPPRATYSEDEES